jgi:glycerophosphoryl diester phosphodiesterase
MKRIIHIVGAIVLLLAGFIYLNNADWLTGAPEGGPTLLAHRGLAQTFDLDGVTDDSCTATRIHAPTHPYLENTVASMAAAFRAGADIEFDIHPTTDYARAHARRAQGARYWLRLHRRRRHDLSVSRH